MPAYKIAKEKIELLNNLIRELRETTKRVNLVASELSGIAVYIPQNVVHHPVLSLFMGQRVMLHNLQYYPHNSDLRGTISLPYTDPGSPARIHAGKKLECIITKDWFK